MPAPAFTFNTDFAKASAICAVGFAVMTLTMNAAPLSLQMCGYSLPMSSTVLQVHFALMYLPSFFNPALVALVGLRGLVALGVIASGVGCLLTLLPDQTLPVYMIELGLSGIGWNFLFNGGTLLLADTYPASGKTRAQGLNSLFVYSANLVASFSAGALMASYGWQAVNLACLPLLVLASRRRGPAVLRGGNPIVRPTKPHRRTAPRLCRREKMPCSNCAQAANAATRICRRRPPTR